MRVNSGRDERPRGYPDHRRSGEGGRCADLDDPLLRASRPIEPEARSASNYRGYSSLAVERLRFIRSAQASGFSLNDVEEMLALTQGDGSPCADVAALMERRLADVRNRIRELRRVERSLATSLATLCKQGPDWCNEIERMRGRTPAVAAVSRRLARRA